MADFAHEWTDDQIETLRKKFADTYRLAAVEMQEKLEGYLADFDADNERWKKDVADGRATRKQYDAWLKAQSVRKEYLVDMANTLASDAANTNRLASDMINDTIPRVYAENADYAAYGIESHFGKTHMFDLCDQDTIRRLMGMDEHGQIIHEVIPVGPPNVPLQSLRVDPDTVKDVRWNRQKFTASITQSILQGESIPNTAKRLQSVLNMNLSMSVRAARTAMTSAENAGRVDSYQRAERIGIKLEQEWLATLDERTRHSHRQMDGKHVKVGERFANGLKFPGDPEGRPEEVWNCRCALVAWFPEDGEESAKGRFSRLPEGMTYEDWKGMKEDERKRGVINDGNPETLAGVKRGSPMTFDEANELRGNPNYNMAAVAYDEYLQAKTEYNSVSNGFWGASDRVVTTDEYKAAKKRFEEAEKEYRKAQREQNGYRINCQTCVVANEARRRGYDVQATANTTGSTNARVARQTNLAWIDRITGKHPDYIIYDGEGKEDYAGRPIPTYARYVKWLEDEGTIEEGARYTIEFWWKGRSSSGHIVSIERTSEGLRMYDPQCGESYDGKGIREYLKRVKYKSSIRGTQIADGPQLLKVSDYDFDLDICEQILTEAEHDS